jgi:hypothetical protein
LEWLWLHAAAWSALESHIATVARAQPIVLVCKTDKRSEQVAAIFRAGGIEHVQSY